MIVAELMTNTPQTVGPADTLKLAHEKMTTGRFRQLPVIEDEKLVGILTDRDVRQYIGKHTDTLVAEVMSGHPLSVSPSDPVERAAHLLVTNKFGSLPVVEDGKLRGIITATDLLRALEALLGTDGTARIDLNLDGSGEIAAATSLVQSICPLLGMGTYRRSNAPREVLYVQVSLNSAQNVAETLKDYGFKVLTVHS
jgi:acetoin utilization protein AcuB